MERFRATRTNKIEGKKHTHTHTHSLLTLRNCAYNSYDYLVFSAGTGTERSRGFAATQALFDPSCFLDRRGFVADSQQRRSLRSVVLHLFPPPLRRDLPELLLDIFMAPPVYVVCSVDDDCMASDFPGWRADSFSLQQEPASSSSSSSAFAVSCEGFSSTHVWNFGCRTRTSSKHRGLGQKSGDEDMEKEEEEDGEEEEEEEEREAGGLLQRMICGKEGAGEGLDDEGRGSSSATGGGGAGWEGASGISQTGGRSEAAAAAGGAGGENRGPRDGKWFRLSDSCSLALHRGDITKWFVNGKTDAIVSPHSLSKFDGFIMNFLSLPRSLGSGFPMVPASRRSIHHIQISGKRVCTHFPFVEIDVQRTTSTSLGARQMFSTLISMLNETIIA